jgi:VIT1/CCC1 family predicted Fe2+/Mn2+ transporter/rubrerythrin
MKEQKVIRALRAAWEREIEAAQLYRLLSEHQKDEKRRRILLKLAEAEEGHAREFADRILALGGIPPREATRPTATQRLLARTLGTDAMLRRLEAEEDRAAAQFHLHAQALAADPDSHTLFTRIEAEEKQHAVVLHTLKTPDEPRTRLEALLKGEKWHVSTGSWIGDAIYGVNDGLGAVFGVVSGMAGYAGSQQDAFHFVVASGLVATLASALSMGSSAFMASKSEREVYEAEIGRERAEIAQSPEHEKEELELIYQMKGFSPEESHRMAERIATQPELFLQTMAQEELGLSARRFPNPWVSAASAAVSTAIGGIVPVLPFLFLRGNPAVLASAVIGMAAHFAVGAAKSLVTARPWWASGLEMTLVGFLTGGVTYVLGKMFHIG